MPKKLEVSFMPQPITKCMTFTFANNFTIDLFITLLGITQGRNVNRRGL